ncbi:MarR family transcriptional regulator [Candidatus Woesearchaeota archaeon]|nr:MarR family transcriptional regulator [Candidatus Woesearchaeota archaeon]
MRLILLIMILSFASVAPVFANFYADVEFDVGNDGVVTISGNSNHPLLADSQTNDLTSKKGRYWLLNISIADNFSNYIYRIKLPRYSSVNYLKTPELSRFEYGDNSLLIIGTGENQKFDVVVQYSIGNQKPNYFQGAVIVSFAVVVILVYWVSKNRRSHKIPMHILTDRQKRIVSFVVKHKRVTQKELQDELKLPKSSLSRNVESLVRKNILKKNQKGMSNVLSINVPDSSGKFR